MATIKLFEAWLQSQAINEFGPHGDIEMSYITKAFDSDGMFDGLPEFFSGENNLNYEKIKSILIRNGIIFSVTPEHAAAILTNLFITIKSTVKELTPATWLARTGEIKLMPHPEKPTEVLTTGTFTNEVINDPGNPDQASKYENIALYCNNKSLSEIAYQMKYRKGALNGGGVMLEVSPEGTLTWEGSVTGFKFKLYGTKTTTSAVSKEVATTTTWEVPATGKTIVKTLPGTVFATGQTTLANSKEVDAAVAELQNLKSDPNTQIIKIEIESSASGDRPVDGQSGYPANTKPGTYKLGGTPYIVKTTDTSGNAKLARGRGETIKAKFSSFGVAPVIKSVIQDGGDAAQYAKITITVDKKGKPTEVFTKTDLETILSKPKQTTGLDATRTLSAWTAITNPQGKNY